MCRLLPNAPQNVSGVFNTDGSIAVTFDSVDGALSYLTHYGDANQSDPNQANKMGYTETNSWTLAAADVPTLAADDKIYLYVQAYNEVGLGANDVEKARYLHDGEFTGSAWSNAVILIKK